VKNIYTAGKLPTWFTQLKNWPQSIPLLIGKPSFDYLNVKSIAMNVELFSFREDHNAIGVGAVTKRTLSS
jgi:hypothetical protein